MNATARIAWRWPIAILLLVILFVPIRRYNVTVNLPFQLEPYRALVAVVLGAWLLSLLSQREVRLRRSGLEGPLFLSVAALLASDALNPGRFAASEEAVTKGLVLSLSFVLVFFFLVSVVRSLAAIERVLKLLVAGGAVLGVFAMIESRTGWSPFVSLDRFIPIFQPTGEEFIFGRGATLRAFASAEHPIALGAVLMILAPVALYLAIKYGRWWWVSVFLLTIGGLATVSRTAVVMLVAASVVICILRFGEVWRYAPLMIPLIVATHFAVPGALGSIKQSFQPEGGLIAEQSAEVDEAGSGRVADLGPALEEFSRKPIVGYGAGTRVVTGENANARILDNQWLGSLLEVGLVGTFAVAWLFFRYIRRVGAEAKRVRSPEGWLLVGLTASVAAFATGMFTFDAFAFTQVTFVLYVLLALGSSLVLADDAVLARSKVSDGPSLKPDAGIPRQRGDQPAV